MKFTEKELKEIKEELNKQVLLTFNENAKTIPNIKFEEVEDILEDKAAHFKIKGEDIKSFSDLFITSISLNRTFLSQQVIPFVDKTILENASEDVKGLYSLYSSPKYYSEVKDELNFDNNVINTILVPVNRLPENKEFVKIGLNNMFKVDVDYKVLQFELDEDVNIEIRVKVSKGVIKNDK